MENTGKSITIKILHQFGHLHHGNLHRTRDRMVLPPILPPTFELSEKELAFLPMSSAFGGLCALALAPAMGKRFDKKKSVIISTVALGCFSPPLPLRFANLFPENNSPLLLPIYFITLWGAYTRYGLQHPSVIL